ncbi:sensor domain-containing protein [Metabacillus malikii]|uniref:Diguanylate cyclase (GGDEF)-like protein/PAS domain S-box-containing protein n=1 Tax=Metabacillus malikii TaxID=1504265 RepID=A0ABT9ZIQ7_9BACI|nr:bifunctional diguanylate cyclase/phosphodiesterase [Metabacillus malikii]MDQ0231711.1 diguanylate cyclase (GGDEF)-like protein/PAS domain S-box-containing protein [Metabacillus malikii]
MKNIIHKKPSFAILISIVGFFLLTAFILSLQINTLLKSMFITLPLILVLLYISIVKKNSTSQQQVDQKNYFNLLEMIPETVIIHQNGIILYINRNGAKILGSDDPEDFIQKSIYQFLHPSVHEQARTRLMLLSEKSNLDLIEQKAISLDGNELHVETLSFSIDYNGQKAVLSISRNISYKKKASEERIHNEIKYRTLFEYANDAIYLFAMDDNGMPKNFIDINQSACERFGYTKEELLTMSPLDITSSKRKGKVSDTQQELIEHNHTTFEGEYMTKTGEKIPSEISVRLLRLGDKQYGLAISRDIRERKIAEEKMWQMAYVDRLTGLYNRRYFKSHLEELIQSLNEKQVDQQLAIIYFDINRFKFFNKTFGSHIGDQLLIKVAKRIKSVISGSNLIARQSDDEFSILLKDASQSTVSQLTNKVLQQLQQPIEINGQDVFITLSIGVSFYPYNGDNSDTLLKNADTAMSYAKAKGMNNVKFYSVEMNKQNKRKLLLEGSLRNALAKGELQLFYQPKINVHTRQLVGVEALIRWNSKELGMISPGEFIPIAEETGLIIPIGEWVLQTACKQNKLWQDLGYSPINMSINLSARQFQQLNLLEMIERTLQETQLDAKYLNLEITETMAMHDLDQSVEKLGQLKSLGVSISLDDFGTGYSSLNYLHKFPLDVLKIDKSFIHNILSDQQSAAIVKAIISVSKSLNLTVIAEGVEVLDQLEFLISENCDEVQGYYFSPPVPAIELESMLLSRTVN